jgi:ABC-type branched-subunit amino acid transport system substrate-binding protein
MRALSAILPVTSTARYISCAPRASRSRANILEVVMRASRLAVGLVCASFVVACSKPQPPADQTAAPLEANKPAAAAASEDIKVGQTMPYSGPASAYGTIGRVEAAYFKKINDDGGVNGRKLQLLSLDDAYSPPKAVEQTRKLVEQEHVLFMFNSVGTANNTAVHKYLNTKQVPQLFVSSGATKWGDPQNFPWTMGLNPTYQLEGKTYAKHILANSPKAKIAVLYQNDDYGKDLLKGLKDGLGDKVNMIVREATYEVSDATIDSQIATLQSSKANTFVDITTPKFAAQAVRRIYDSGWKPTHYLNQNGASISSVLIPAGAEKAIGALTIGYFKDPTDAQFDNDPQMQRFREFMKKYYPEGDANDGTNVYGYIAAQAIVQVLKQCGSDLSAQNVMRQAENLKDFAPELLLPGVTMNTSPTDFFPFDQVQVARFNGKNWVASGQPLAL